MVLYAIYGHSKGSISDFTTSTENLVSKIINDKTIKASVITGDFNIDLIQYALHWDTADFLNTMLQNSFLPTVLLPTRITDHSATLIDYIYLYEKQFHGNCVSANLFTDISDHLANFLIFKQNTKNIRNRPSIRIFGEKIK